MRLISLVVVLAPGWTVGQEIPPTRAVVASRAEVDYSTEVRPLLAANCFPCHGPDDAARAAGLRLDLRASAVADLGDGRFAIQPGHPDGSELVRRIESSDPADRMPPPETHKTLTAAHIATLRQWIAEGAQYAEHWAFVPPRRVAPPPLDPQRFPEWHRNPIDRFLLARILEAGLEPSPPAAVPTLIRRLYLDLLGLPPTPAEQEKWAARLQGPGPDHPLQLAEYAALVDELLASPHYGEHWAQRWLDLARYADTNGYEKDRPRPIWPYRDWVIRALNNDLPFARFTREQLAGDLLPAPDRDQLVATGFHRNTMLNEEGGIDPLEYRFYAMTDRVATTGTVWLGLTLGCAQCHSHKFDPISHREYYQLLAVLNNADEPELPLPTADEERIWGERQAEADRLRADLPSRWPVAAGAAAAARSAAFEAALSAWIAAQRQAPIWQLQSPADAQSATVKLLSESDQSLFVSGDITKDDTYTVRLARVPAGTTGIRLEALPDERLPGGGPGLAYFEGPAGDFFLGEFTLQVSGPAGWQPLPLAAAQESYAHNHFGNAPVSAALALDGDPQTGWSCAGRFGERHVAAFQLAAPLPAESDLQVTLRFGRHYPCSLGRFRLATTTAAGPLPAPTYSLAVEALLHRDPASWSSAERQQVQAAFAWQAPELQETVAQIRELERRVPRAASLILRERPAENPRTTFRHHRGEFLQPREPVEPGTPACLPPLASGERPPDRLAFADWLVSPQNPLTPRVQVNRAWAALFGQGLVRTEGDFGLQGEPPSHPELLDWLASEFVANGMSLKQLHRSLVLTAAYRQSPRVTALHRERDPQNRLLARANRNRLRAEQVRDVLLAASGLLNLELYGPPVHPPQPEGATEIAYGGGGWTADSGPARFRRGIYTFRKRTAPFAMFTTFDAPSGEVCLAQREASNTPLQALTVLNDPALHEAAVYLGAQLASASTSDAAKLTELMRRVVARPPDATELEMLTAFLADQRRRLETGELDPAAIAALPAAGASTPHQANPLPADAVRERAVWTITARAIFNLDEAIMRN